MIKRILDLMKENGYTGIKLAQELNASSTLVSDWKSGKSKPTVQQIIFLSQLFNVPTDYLLLGKNFNKSQIEPAITGSNAINNSPHSTITISNGTTTTFELTDFEKELFRLYGVLSVKNKNELLAYAYKLEQQQMDDRNGN